MTANFSCLGKLPHITLSACSRGRERGRGGGPPRHGGDLPRPAPHPAHPAPLQPPGPAHHCHCYRWVNCCSVSTYTCLCIVYTETQKQKQKLYILHIYFPAVTTWTPPTTRSTPRPRAPPTRRSTTTRTTTTTTTTTTRRVEVATTPQYIHFYERPQLSDLPEQPDFYHVYNNEVGIILIHNLIRFLNFMLILWMDKYTKFSDTVTKSPYLKSWNIVVSRYLFCLHD